MRIRHVGFDDPAAEPVLAGLADEYDRRYGRADRVLALADARAEDFAPPRGAFVVLVDDDGRTVAGGGLRPLSDDTAELKRMWTAPEHRRRGHARTLVQALEAVARDRGYTRVRLETGPAQPEALALYRQLGFTEVDKYGVHEEAFGFERSLTTPDGTG